MRKFGFIFLGLGLLAILYYFIFGKNQLITEVKKQVNHSLLMLKSEGFYVENHQKDNTHTYVELAIKDSKKALHFFHSHGIAMQASDIKSFKGAKVGIDFAYLPDSFTSIALHITPLTLPTALQKNMQALQKLLDQKVIQIHIAINTLANGFKGYIKDIEQHNTTLNLSLKTSTFEGVLKKHKLHSFTQKLQYFNLTLRQELNATLKDFNHTYTTDGHQEDTHQYAFTLCQIQLGNEALALKHSTINAQSHIHHHLATFHIQNHNQYMALLIQNSGYQLEDTNLTAIIENLDLDAFEALQTIDPNNKEDIDAIVTQLLSKGIKLAIPNLSSKYIHMTTKKIDGFSLQSHISIDQNTPMNLLKNNPNDLLPYMDAHLEISLSPALMEVIAKDPRAMLAMMMFPAQNIHNKKVYQIELKKGKALLNGKALF